MKTLFERCPLPWNYAPRKHICVDEGGQPEFIIFSAITQYCVAIVNSEEEAIDLTNLVNSTLTNKQKRSYGHQNAQLFVVKNKKNGAYCGRRFHHQSALISRAKLWRSEGYAKSSIPFHERDNYEVIPVRVETLKNAYTG